MGSATLIVLIGLLSKEMLCKEDNFLLHLELSQGIIKVDLTTGARTILEYNHNHTTPLGIDFDPINEVVYWADRGEVGDMLSKSWLAGIRINAQPQDSPVRIYQSDASLPSDVAVDYISRVIYYIDKQDQEVGVVNVNLDGRAALIRDGLVEPFTIDVDPIGGYMYFSDSDKSTNGGLKKAQMDGTDVQTLFSDTGFITELTIDHQEHKLYWIDNTRKAIYTSDLIGTKMILLQTLDKDLWGIAADTNHLYLTAFNYEYIIQIKKDGTNANNFGFSSGSSQSKMSDIIIYRESRQLTEKNACSIQNGGCSHHCLPLPNAQKVCKCPEGYFMKNPTECVPAPFDRFIILTDQTRRAIFRLDLDKEIYERTHIVGHGIPAGITVDKDTHRMYFVDSLLAWFSYDGYVNLKDFKILAKFNRNLFEPQSLIYNKNRNTFYFTDSKQHAIMAVQISSALTPQKLYSLDNLNSPAGLTQDIKNGQMYWTVKGLRPRVMRGDLSGDQRSMQTLFDKQILEPNDIVYDEITHSLYWCDGGLGKIEKVELSSPIKRCIYYKEETAQFTTLTVGGGHLYFAVQDEGSVYKMDRFAGGEAVTVGVNHFEDIFDMVYVSYTNEEIDAVNILRCNIEEETTSPETSTTTTDKDDNVSQTPSSMLPIIVGVGVGGAVVIIIIITAGCICYRMTNKSGPVRQASGISQSSGELGASGPDTNRDFLMAKKLQSLYEDVNFNVADTLPRVNAPPTPLFLPHPPTPPPHRARARPLHPQRDNPAFNADETVPNSSTYEILGNRFDRPSHYPNPSRAQLGPAPPPYEHNDPHPAPTRPAR